MYTLYIYTHTLYRHNVHKETREIFTGCQPLGVDGPVLCRHVLLAVGTLLPQLLNQLEGERAPSAFIPAEMKKAFSLSRNKE